MVGTVIDVEIVAITAGKAIYGVYAIRKFIKQHRHYMLRKVAPQLEKMYGSVLGHLLGAAIDIALTIAGTRIGGVIVKELDYLDKKIRGIIMSSDNKINTKMYQKLNSIPSRIIISLIYLGPVGTIILKIIEKDYSDLLMLEFIQILCIVLLVINWVSYFNYKKAFKELDEDLNLDDNIR